MSGTINVRVTDKETGNQSVITYKAFQDTQYRFTLIGQVDDLGNLMESDPNLSPQHQRKVVAKSPAVVDVGGNSGLNPGPHEFHGEGTVPQWMIDKGQKQMDQKFLENAASTKGDVTPFLSGQPLHVEQSDITRTGPDIAATGFRAEIVIEESFPDCLPASPTDPTPAAEPIKERKKPGPKPKNKEA